MVHNVYWLNSSCTCKRGRAILQERHALLKWSTCSWKNQMEALIDQYLEWKAGGSEQGGEMDIDMHSFEVTSIHMSSEFSSYCFDQVLTWNAGCIQHFLVLQKPNELANVALLRNGLPGCSPIDPAVVISLDTLKLYHWLQQHCGQLSVQYMACTLCDLHNVSVNQHPMPVMINWLCW